ncbi:TetR/AcrR family transcriptional regulator [Cellulomonas edaphi]|uniref:TetR/AcrR family transcriptional regulator n=1 Tax=Cellulomonas edaphi TaxID=3053468 RepID=A0ABT7SC72_9CELL|nr:TetR/AcrR family transcriptional regulator [Cellulomons edaphi]MDM7832549.1 TetR/AcrR family transcriptional regulator [Cellulomons edaphi]
MSGGPLRADAARNRAKLLAAAIDAFGQDGADVPLETIAARAGVGVGTLYRHFSNREALVEAAYRQEVAALCDAVPDLLDRHPLAVDALREWSVRFVHYAATKRGMGSALRSAVGADSNLFSQTRERIVGALALLLAAGAADGSTRPDADADDLWIAMGGVWNIPLGEAWEGQVRRLLDLVIDGLRYGARTTA